MTNRDELEEMMNEHTQAIDTVLTELVELLNDLGMSGFEYPSFQGFSISVRQLESSSDSIQ